MTEAQAALLKELRALPRYYISQRYPMYGGRKTMTDPENPERGELVRLADVEAALAAETVPLQEPSKEVVKLLRAHHEQALSANPLFSVEHWAHNAGPDWPHEPDDDSYLEFDNCQHPVCRWIRDRS